MRQRFFHAYVLSMQARIFSIISSLTRCFLGESLNAKDTSVVDTPRAFAKSFIVTFDLFITVNFCTITKNTRTAVNYCLYICKKLEKKHKNKYDLSEILSMLLYTRVLYPGSKLSSIEDAKRLIEQPSADIHQVYRALSLLATEFYEVQADVYKRSLKLAKGILASCTTT